MERTGYWLCFSGEEMISKQSMPAVIIRSLIVLACFYTQSPLLAQTGETQQHQFPDVPDAWAEAVKYENEYFSVGVLFGALLDYTILDQDQQSIGQVGKQENDFEARSFRLLFAGTLDFMGPWSYVVAAEYKGFDRAPEDAYFNFVDVALGRHFADGSGRLRIGKQKQPFIYEMVGDSANLMHHERFLEPFFVSRSWGVSYTHSCLEKRLGLQMGWYNDWFVDSGDFSGEGNQFAFRLTGLPIWRDAGARLLHVGISVRYQEDEQDFLRYRGRPGSHVTDFYVDSGEFEADYALHLGLEALWQGDKLTVLGEYAKARVSANKVGNPRFDGFYVTASYLFNGELRPYNTMVRFSRRVKPGGGWGAFEPFVRFGRVDLDDAGIRGGSMEKWYAGLNWWATRRWKMSVGYGDIELDRFGAIGLTKQVLFRLQWIGP